ncbi:unnamed protein product [Microthlaspi erraticum]|uniref:RRM domain-containing protein n=1 Tax=Microthlaspi erraticum TaxID=1685480 RepID=A0A6D2LHL4_9BRAS|nr:unnamed protein product [Microthlaspi erraticum]
MGVVVELWLRIMGNMVVLGQQYLVGRPSRELLRLPPDASNTLCVEGLPSKRNGDPIVLCFVDFESPACAATARTALQGCRMNEDEPDSKILQIQFSRKPGPRPGQRGGSR